MSHFEYISVAIALINAMVVARLLGGVAPSLRPSAFFYIHFAWVICLILVTIMQWWSLWGARGVEWNAVKFVWVLLLPSLLFLRASILLTDHPENVQSFEEHFFATRVAFFSLSLVTGFVVAITPWVLDIRPWFAMSMIHIPAATVILLSVSGLWFRGRISHTIIVCVFMIVQILNLFFVPAYQG